MGVETYNHCQGKHYKTEYIRERDLARNFLTLSAEGLILLNCGVGEDS